MNTPSIPEKNQHVQRIDLRAVLSDKLGRRARFVPDALVRAVERLICVDELNSILAENAGKTGVDFCRDAMRHLDVTVEAAGMERLPDDGRLIFACNHPLGGVDGIALIMMLCRKYGREVYVVVNDILMAVEPLREVFVPVNKHGRQSHEDVAELDRVLASGAPVLFFPAGLVSRLGKNGEIADLEWRSTFINKAIKYGRPVVPLYFEGTNSRSFYKWARRRVRMGLKFNYEMVLLPRELVKMRHTTVRIICGEPVSVEDLKNMPTRAAAVQRIRTNTYSLTEEKGLLQWKTI